MCWLCSAGSLHRHRHRACQAHLGPPAPHGPVPHTGFYEALIIVLALFAVLVAIGIELVIRGLNRREYWAWITGIVISGFLLLGIMSGNVIGAVLGGLALRGLVDPETVAAFRPQVARWLFVR